MLRKRVNLQLCLLITLALPSCGVIQELRDDRARAKILVASDRVKVEYCLNNGDALLAWGQHSISTASTNPGHASMIWGCYKSDVKPSGFRSNFESFKQSLAGIRERESEQRRLALQRTINSGTIDSIIENYRKFIGVTEERYEVTAARQRYEKLSYCRINPSYRSSTDVALRGVDPVTDPIQLIDCVDNVSYSTVAEINSTLESERVARRQDLLESFEIGVVPN